MVCWFESAPPRLVAVVSVDRFQIAEFGLRIWLAAQQVDISVRLLGTDCESAIRNPQSEIEAPRSLTLIVKHREELKMRSYLSITILMIIAALTYSCAD